MGTFAILFEDHTHDRFTMALLKQFSRVPLVLRQCSRGTPALGQLRGYAEAEKKFEFSFASPAKTFFDKSSTVTQVLAPSIEGVVGILPNHVPIVTVLKPGLVTVVDADATSNYFVSSGTLCMNEDNPCHIMAEEAHPVEAFDADRNKSALDDATQRLSAAKDEKEKTTIQIEIDCLTAISTSVFSVAK